ncbi:unnamed protein product [Ectocarpus sp. 4 AP-2014]
MHGETPADSQGRNLEFGGALRVLHFAFRFLAPVYDTPSRCSWFLSAKRPPRTARTSNMIIRCPWTPGDFDVPTTTHAFNLKRLSGCTTAETNTMFRPSSYSGAV